MRSLGQHLLSVECVVLLTRRQHRDVHKMILEQEGVGPGILRLFSDPHAWSRAKTNCAVSTSSVRTWTAWEFEEKKTCFKNPNSMRTNGKFDNKNFRLSWKTSHHPRLHLFLSSCTENLLDVFHYAVCFPCASQFLLTVNLRKQGSWRSETLSFTEEKMSFRRGPLQRARSPFVSFGFCHSIPIPWE